MARERTFEYATEEDRLRAERLSQRAREDDQAFFGSALPPKVGEEAEREERLFQERLEADRLAAPMFILEMAEEELAAQGKIDIEAGEYLIGFEADGEGNPVPIISRPVQPI